MVGVSRTVLAWERLNVVTDAGVVVVTTTDPENASIESPLESNPAIPENEVEGMVFGAFLTLLT